MGSNNSKRYRVRVFWCLWDCDWHTVDELVEQLKDLIPPERAVREGPGKGQNPNYPLDAVMQQGYLRILNRLLLNLAKEGYVELERKLVPTLGKEKVVRARFAIDPVTLFSSKFSEDERSDRSHKSCLIGELQFLLQNRRVELNVQVLASNGLPVSREEYARAEAVVE